MRSPYHLILVVLILTFAATSTSQLSAQDPAYIILRPPKPQPKPQPVAQPRARRSSCLRHGCFGTGHCPVCASMPQAGPAIPSGSIDANMMYQEVPYQGGMSVQPQIVYQEQLTLPEEPVQGSAREGYRNYPIHRVYRQPYAYGWFGASPSSSRARSYGYNRSRVNWSFQ